ncbi:MAG: Fic family protein [Alphaproteobacteria bacterium]|nr:Fic family protein [Alphaproteobacteria bacterium]
MLVLADESEIGEFVLSRNLGRQYGFLHTAFEVWNGGHGLAIDHKFICDLNFYAVQFLSHEPGAYRQGEVMIANSSHDPPRAKDVPGHMVDFLRQLSRRSGKNEGIGAASYALWRLNWIHPFIQGNGRTARALCYFVLCKELKMWLPGNPIIPERIRKTRPRYEAGLEYADKIYKESGRIDLSKIEAYLNDLLTQQLNS